MDPSISQLLLLGVLGGSNGSRAASPSGPTIVLNDAFTGSAGTQLASHAPDVGGVWSGSVQAGSGSITLDGAGNVSCTPPVGSLTDAESVYINGGVADGTIACGFTTAPDNNVVMGVIFRRVDATNYWRAVANSTPTIFVYKRIAGVDTLVDNEDVSNYTEMDVVISGSSIKVYADGVLVSDLTDAALASGTGCGIFYSCSELLPPICTLAGPIKATKP